MTNDYSINTGKIIRFGTVDYVLFVITLLISAFIGIFYAIVDRKRNTTKEFLLGGKNMNVFPVAMSLCVTFMSALTILGNPAEIYNYNTMFWWLIVAFLFGITGAAFLFVPFFYNLNVTSTFEYLEMRFSKPVRLLGSTLLILQTLLYMSFLLYAPSLALNAVTGLNLWGSVVGMGVVSTFYTSLGGMKAVLWTDTFQAGVIFAGLLAVTIQGSILQGGFINAWEIANNRSRILLDDFSVDPKTRHSVWSMVIGGMCFWMYLYGLNQAQVQRCLSCPSVKKARIALFLNLPALMLIVSLSCMIGVVMFAFYADCHPIKYGLIDKTDQLVALFVMDILGHLEGLPGIFVSCVVSGSLRSLVVTITYSPFWRTSDISLSSGLNALSAVTFRDWIQGLNCCINISEFRSTIINKIIVLSYGVLAIGLAWVVSQLGSVLQAVYVVFGILNGPVLGVMTLGMLFPWSNKWGALFGTLGSLIMLLWIGMGAFVNEIKTPLTPTITSGCNWTAVASTTTTVAPNTTKESLALEPLYRMSYMWYTGLGMVLVWAFGMVISAITGLTKPTSLDPRLVMPIFDLLFFYLPEKVRKPLRFGIVHKDKYNLPPVKSVNLSIHGNSDASISDGQTPVDEKQPNDVTNGYTKPKFDLNEDGTASSKEIEIQQGVQNRAYVSDDNLDTRL